MRLAAPLLAMLAIGCAASPARTTFGGSKQARAATCTQPADCAVVPISCCGFCGAAAHGDARAVLRGAATTRDECLQHGCGDCHQEPDPQLRSYCSERGTCRLLDLTQGPLVQCATDADCTMIPLQCCECGADSWVAVATTRALVVRRRICPDETVTCPACVGRAPAIAVCRASRCVQTPG
jgi:hypothetical protein